MSQTYELAVVGFRSSVLIYKAAGIEAFAVNNQQEAQDTTEKLFKEMTEDGRERFAVLLVEENFYAELPNDLLEKFAKKALPAVVPVPSPQSSGGNFSAARLSKIVERAIGSDILG